jgi:uncharacterized membrane protein YbhN (UPF0104 family)
VSVHSRLIVPAVLWLGLAAALLALCFSGPAGSAWERARDARAAPLVLVACCGVLLPVIHARRWQLVMRALGTDISVAQATDLTVSASLVNYASPGYLGAPAKAFLANRAAGAPYTRSAVSMAFEQGLDFLVLLGGSAIAVVVLGPDQLGDLIPGGTAIRQIALAAVAGLVVAALAYRFRARARRMLAGVRDAFAQLGQRVDRGMVAWLTLGYWLAQVAVVALLLWALRLPLTFTSVLALSTIPLLAGQIAPLPGGIGAREAAILVLSGALDVSVSGLLGLAVLQRVLLVAALPVSLGIVRLARAQEPAR